MGKLTISMADMFNFQRVTFNLAAFTPTNPHKKIRTPLGTSSPEAWEIHLLSGGLPTFLRAARDLR